MAITINSISKWRDILENISKCEDEEFGNDVEILYLDNVPGPGEWALCHGYDVLEDGFEEEDDAIARLEYILRVVHTEPVASIVISNTGSVLIYEATDEYVIAGFNDELPEICEVHHEADEDYDGADDDEDIEYEPIFHMGQWRLSLRDAMRLNF